MIFYRWTLRLATAIGVLATLAGITSIAYWAESSIAPWPYLGSGIGMVLSGLAATVCALLLESAESEILRLRHERDITCAERDALRLRSRGLERRAESLTLVREIHRSTNIVSRGERLRQILTVIGQLGERVEATLFNSSENPIEGLVLRPAAYLRTDETGDVFLRFDRPFQAGAGISVVDAASLVAGSRMEFTADLHAESECIGRIEAALNDGLKRKPAETLTSLLESSDLDSTEAAEALEYGQVLRFEDPTNDYRELVHPLAAEGKPVGVLRVRMPDKDSSEESNGISDLEEVLSECAKHVGLALKKEADVDRAEIDGLTGLVMKREFEPRLTEALRVGHEEKRSVALLVIDIDHFKKVNDTHGHRSGDVVLRGVASLVRRHVRTCDTAFRYGGEELCVILPGSGVREAKATAERLREAAENSEFTGDKGQTIKVTISLGLASYDPKKSTASNEKARNPAELFRRADSAVYSAKNGGRNRVVAWGQRVPKAKSAEGKTQSMTKAKTKKRRKRAKKAKAAPAAAPVSAPEVSSSAVTQEIKKQPLTGSFKPQDPSSIRKSA